MKRKRKDAIIIALLMLLILVFFGTSYGLRQYAMHMQMERERYGDVGPMTEQNTTFLESSFLKNQTGVNFTKDYCEAQYKERIGANAGWCTLEGISLEKELIKINCSCARWVVEVLDE